MWNRSKGQILQQEGVGGWNHNRNEDEEVEKSASTIGVPSSDYECRLQSIRDLYEMRFQTLATTIRDGYHQILSDDLLQTMKEDPVSEQFVHQRVTELFEKIVFSEREVVIDKLSTQYATLKAQYSALDTELRREKESREYEGEQSTEVISRLKEEALRERQQRVFFETELKITREGASAMQDELKNKMLQLQQHFQERIDENIEEMQQIAQRCNELENLLAQSQNRELAIQKEAHTLAEQFTQINDELNELQVKEAALTLDVTVANERVVAQNQTIEKLNRELENIALQCKAATDKNTRMTKELDAKNAHINGLEGIYQLKYSALEKDLSEVKQQASKEANKASEKINGLKEKINESRKIASEFEAALATSTDQLGASRDELVGLQEKAQRMLNDMQAQHEKTLREERHAANAKIAESEKRHELNLKEIERNNAEKVQRSSEIELAELRASERQLRGMLDEKLLMLQRDYISKQLHQSVLAEKEKGILKMKADFDEFIEKFKREVNDKHSSAQSQAVQNHAIEIASLQSNLREAEEHARTYKMQAQQFDSKLITLEEALSKASIESEARVYELRAIESDSKRKQEKLIKLRGRCEAAEKARDDLEGTLIHLRADLESTRMIAKNLESEKIKLADQLMNSRQAGEAARNQVVEAQREVQNLSASVGNHTQVIAFKDEIIQSTKQSLQELKAENTALSTQFFELYNHKNIKSEEEQKRIEDMSLNLQKSALELQEKGYQLDLLRQEMEVSLEARRTLEEQLQELQSEVIQKERELNHSHREQAEMMVSTQKLLSVERNKYEKIQGLLNAELNWLRKDLLKLQEYVQQQVRVRTEETTLWMENITNKSKDMLREQNMSVNEHIHQKLSSAEQIFSQEISELLESKNAELQEISAQADNLDSQNQELIAENNSILQKVSSLKHEIEQLSQQNIQLMKLNETNKNNLISLETALEQRQLEFIRTKEETTEKDEEVKHWREKFVAKDAQAIKLEQDLSQLRLRISTVTKAEANEQLLAQKVRSSEQIIIQSEKDVSDLRDSLEKAKRSVQQKQQEIDLLQHQLSQIARERDNFYEDNLTLHQQLKQLALAHNQNSQNANMEIEELHRMLTQQAGNINTSNANHLNTSDLQRQLDEDTKQLTRKVVDLQHLNKILEVSKTSILRSTPNKPQYFIQQQSQQQHQQLRSPLNKNTRKPYISGGGGGGEPNHTFAGLMMTTSNPSNASLMNTSVERNQQNNEMQTGTQPFYSSKSAVNLHHQQSSSSTAAVAVAAATINQPYLENQLRRNQKQFNSHHSYQQADPKQLTPSSPLIRRAPNMDVSPRILQNNNLPQKFTPNKLYY